MPEIFRMGKIEKIVVVNHMLQIGPVSVAHPHGAAWALNGAYTRLAQSHCTMFPIITKDRKILVIM